jgi:hypothetical protein
MTPINVPFKIELWLELQDWGFEVVRKFGMPQGLDYIV